MIGGYHTSCKTVGDHTQRQKRYGETFDHSLAVYNLRDNGPPCGADWVALTHYQKVIPGLFCRNEVEFL